MGAERLAGICLVSGFWLPLAVCTWLAFTPSPPDAVFRVSDVVLHGAAFAYLSFSLGLAHDLSMGRVAVWMLGYGAAIELLQGLIPERSAELKDLMVDGAGIAVGLGLLYVAGGWCRRTLLTVADVVVGRD